MKDHIGGTTCWPEADPVASGGISSCGEQRFGGSVRSEEQRCRETILEHGEVDEEPGVGTMNKSQEATVLIACVVISTQEHGGTGREEVGETGRGLGPKTLGGSWPPGLLGCVDAKEAHRLRVIVDRDQNCVAIDNTLDNGWQT